MGLRGLKFHVCQAFVARLTNKAEFDFDNFDNRL